VVVLQCSPRADPPGALRTPDKALDLGALATDWMRLSAKLPLGLAALPCQQLIDDNHPADCPE